MTMPKLDEPTRQQVPDFHVTGFIGIDRPEWATKDVAQTERPVVYATASSTSPDLDSDRMSNRAIQQMSTGFIGLTIFLNHRYQWPEDVFGTVLRTYVVERDGFKDLDMEIAVEDQNPRAMIVYNMIKNGTRAGVSVGILVIAYQTTDDKHLGRQVIEITDILALEASIAGIPSNRRSWVREAIKSLYDRGDLALDENAVGVRPWLVGKGREDKTMDPEFKGAVPFKKFPLAARGDAWDVNAADAAIRKLCGGPEKENMDWGKYAQYHGWVDDDDKESFGGYKLLHHKPETVFKGVVAVAVVLAGGRGGVAIPDADVAGVKSHVAKHYVEFDEKAPWEREGKDFTWLPEEIEVAKGLEIDLGETQKVLFPEVKGSKLAQIAESLAQHIAEQEFAHAFWQLNYAFSDAVWEVIENGDAATRVDTVRSLLDEYSNLMLNLINSMPQIVRSSDDVQAAKDFLLSALDVTAFLEKAGARHSAADTEMIQTLHDTAAKLGAACKRSEDDKSGDEGLDKDAGLGKTQTDEIIAQRITELTVRADEATELVKATQTETARYKELLDQYKQVVDEILALPLAIRTQDGDAAGDAARKVINRYPGVSAYVQSLLKK